MKVFRAAPAIAILLALNIGLLSCRAAESPSRVPPGVKPLEAPGIHNLFALGTNVFSGSAPEGEEAFAALAHLGVKTIITVDGAKPDLETARKHGLRYVHLPHGYDGIQRDLQVQLARAGETLAGPIYVHCHHGKHRGPAAAAVICMSQLGWTKELANQWLVTAGTSTNYAGLYRTVADFSAPTPAELGAVPAEFPQTAKVSGMVEAMVNIDERWEHLKAIRRAGWQTPPGHPDIVPANETVILWEAFREAERLPDAADHGEEFQRIMKTSETEARALEHLLRQHEADAARATKTLLDRRFEAISKACSACHKQYRD